MRRVFKFLFVTLVAFLYVILSVITALFAIIFGGLAKLMPIKSWHRAVMKMALQVPVIWASISNQFLKLPSNHEWKIEGKGPLDTNHWYMLISNHRSWLDILVLGYVFNRKAPVIKFFMKKELLWGLPILGLSCWLLDYPFVQRHSRKEIRKRPHLKYRDIHTTQKACEKFKEFPTTVVNFMEGTRFTPEKHQRQHSPYLHLLKPKAGGTAIVIKELQEKLSGILNVTLHYSRRLSFWNYFQGEPFKITVHYELLPLTPDLIGDYYKDREFRRHFQRWLNGVWEQKDLLLDELSRSNDQKT
ncbi:acyltransferase [Coxiella burnetii]|uniref:acyltransferase n=1 Tax=Coxiella burnetii TaxID=777 RepID=UPI000183CF5C|nr:acyltransferase [Coxiella burnetii]ACJ19307.1 acyltransferase family protein [Coxiella burnetii CbuG_Q212]ATN67627.1 acyltransferase [Coxiella burnetii]OYK85372.1 acyltransferase [Coxiella burnetii]